MVCHGEKFKGIRNKTKDESLAQLIKDPNDWHNKLLVETKTATKSDVKEQVEQTFTRGQLVQIHGEEEVADSIRKGKWVEGTDKWGDPTFTKADTRTITQNRTDHSISGSRQPLGY